LGFKNDRVFFLKIREVFVDKRPVDDIAHLNHFDPYLKIYPIINVHFIPFGSQNMPLRSMIFMLLNLHYV
jgi:hypothetical protein